MEGSAALISIRPVYTEKILAGEKRLEFRRRWTTRHIDFLVVYATSPVKQIVAIVKVDEVIRGSKSKLWELARSCGGGISQRDLFAYMEGVREGVALRFSEVIKFTEGMNPTVVFDPDFRPPQWFRYLRQNELVELTKQIRGKAWESYS